MNITTFYSEITEEETAKIRQLLADRHLCDHFLFALHFSQELFPNPDKCLFLQLMDSNIFSYFDGPNKNINCLLFFKALITSMLVMKKNIQIYSEKHRFSANDLAESILCSFNPFPDSDSAQKELADKIIKSGKHQCGVYFKHTRKNYALFSEPVVSIEKNKNPGIAIGKVLKLSPPFPPLHTGHAAFTASGVPLDLYYKSRHNLILSVTINYTQKSIPIENEI